MDGEPSDRMAALPEHSRNSKGGGVRWLGMDHSIDPATPEHSSAHSLPSRRERLRMFLRLKSQRHLLAASTGALAGLAAILSLALYDDDSRPDVVRLGTGMAGVEASNGASVGAQPVAAARVGGSGEAPAAPESHIGSGEASFYGSELAGNRTASGEIFDPARLTAAHRTLPLGSRVRVTNASNGEDVVVRINDRGPFHGNRVIDLSSAAARSIGLLRTGTARVSLALLLD